MNLRKLVKRLRREAVANPKKATILGVLAVVSLYFWIPLVRGWMSNDEVPSAAPNAAAVAAKPSSPASAAATAENRPSWQQIVRWMHNDPRTTTASPPAKTRAPFELPKTEVVNTEAEVEAEPRPPRITPSAVGLALSGTIVGPRNRVAQINGKTYSVGQSIEFDNEETTVHAAFKLMEVHPRRVVLQFGSERFELTLPEPDKSGKINITSP